VDIPVLREAIRQMKRDLLNYLLENSIGMTVEDMEEYLKSPETSFNPVMDNATFNREGTGHRVSLQSFNAEQLHLNDSAYNNPDERYDYQTFPPAYNTVTMIKLSLLSPAGVNQLLRDLGGDSSLKLATDNVMLGYIRTLDGSNQWMVNPEQMVFARNCTVYQKIFMSQVGQGQSACGKISPEPITPPTPAEQLKCPDVLCVTNLTVSASPKRKKPIYFTATFVNSTGHPQNVKWIALLFEADTHNGFGESFKNQMTVPVGTSQATVEYSGVTGGGPCLKFYAQPARHYGPTDKPLIPNIKGPTVSVQFEVCP
jgi:hypothetical protein